MRARGLRRLNKAPCRKGGRPCRKAKPRQAEVNQQNKGIAVFGSPDNTKVFGDPEAENKEEGGWGS